MKKIMIKEGTPITIDMENLPDEVSVCVMTEYYLTTMIVTAVVYGIIIGLIVLEVVHSLVER